MLHYPFRQSRLKNHTPSARQSNDIDPESNDRFGFNPNRPFERAVLHLMPFMTLSVRCHSLADTLPLFLFCRSPLRLQQIERQTARQSNDINPESNDRFGFDFPENKTSCLPTCRTVRGKWRCCVTPIHSTHRPKGRKWAAPVAGRCLRNQNYPESVFSPFSWA